MFLHLSVSLVDPEGGVLLGTIDQRPEPDVTHHHSPAGILELVMKGTPTMPAPRAEYVKPDNAALYTAPAVGACPVLRVMSRSGCIGADGE